MPVDLRTQPVRPFKQSQKSEPLAAPQIVQSFASTVGAHMATEAELRKRNIRTFKGVLNCVYAAHTVQGALSGGQ